MDIRKCYEVLELRPGYSQADLKLAYKDLVQVWHPDRFVHNPRLKEKAETKLKQINAAYEVLDQALVDRARLQAARSANQTQDPAEDLESIYQPASWSSVSTTTEALKLRLSVMAVAAGLFCLPMALIITVYLVMQHFLVVVALGMVVTMYFAVRWWVEQR
jgi:hypothetical protein